MSDSTWPDQLSPLLRPLQIIVAAMVAGCVFFMVVVLVLSSGNGADENLPLITYIAIGVALTALLARTIIPGVLVARGRRRIAQGTWQAAQSPTSQQPPDAREDGAGDAGLLWALFSSSTILAAALIEGATFFLLIAYMLEHSLPGLVMAVAMCLTLALHMPTRSRAFRWIEYQLTLLQQERQLGG